MSTPINKTLRSVVFINGFLLFMLIGLLGSKPSVALSQSVPTPAVYLPVILNVFPNQAPSVSAGPDQTITLPRSAGLQGVVTDDGLPNPPGHIDIMWSKASGPGAVTFTDPNDAETMATFSQAGKYTLRLTANDGELNTLDELIITVLPASTPNHPPAFPLPMVIRQGTDFRYDGNGLLIGATTTIELVTPPVDPDGDPLSYTWSATNGSITGNGLTATWQRVLSRGWIQGGTVTVVVSDGRGGTATYQIVFD